MEYEEYERMGPPEEIPQNYKQPGVEAQIRMIAQISAEGGPVPTHIGILFEVRTLSEMCICPLGKKKTDEIIRALIAGRNTLWGKS